MKLNMLSPENTSLVISTPLKANGAALAAFFAFSTDIFEYAGRDWLSLLPGWFFLIGAGLGAVVITLMSLGEVNSSNDSTIALSRKTVQAIQAEPNPTDEQKFMMADSLDRIAILERRNLSHRARAMIPRVLNAAANGSYIMFVLGILAALIAMAR